MRPRSKKVPESVRACLWFANSGRLDWERQKDLVITQVLNRGTWEAVRWVYREYGEKAIKNVVRNPKRGLWFPQSLTFWEKFFRLSLKSSSFERALLRLSPTPSVFVTP